MNIQVKGAQEHNLKNVDVSIGDGLTVVTGVSGSGKTSLVFDTLFHESRRRYQEVLSFGSPGSRLSPAKVDSITGLGPAAAVEQNLLNRNPNSTLATASGLHPFFRLLFARFGKRRCRNCDSPLSLLSEDEIVDTIASLLQKQPLDLFAPIVTNAPGSHATLLNLLINEFGGAAVLVDGLPWNDVVESRLRQPRGSFEKPPLGTPQNFLLIPDLSHSIEIHTARLDQSQSFTDFRAAVQSAKTLGTSAIILRGSKDKKSTVVLSFAPVCAHCGTWFDALDPKHFNLSCPSCNGSGCTACKDTGLFPDAAAVTWKDLTFSALLEKSVLEAHHLFEDPGLPSSAHRLVLDITKRLVALDRVGLGYVSLNRPCPSLSRGEAQRVRLAVALSSNLEDILYVLDEPTIGQHPADVLRLIPVFKDLKGPVVFVEHDRIAAAFADYAIDIGPGAGNRGGEIVFAGSPAQLWHADSPTGKYFSLREHVRVPKHNPPPITFLHIEKAHKHNLRDIDVNIPLERLTVITGVSGSGKSTLVEEVLAASLEHGKAVGCAEVVSPALPGLKAVMVDQGPIGKNPRSTPATYTKLSDLIRNLFAAAAGLSASHFSFNRPEGACPTCEGMGALEVRMSYLPSTWIPCGDCGGRRFNDEILKAKVTFGDRELSIADFYDLSAGEALAFLEQGSWIPKEKKEACHILEALIDIGLDYLVLGQPSPTLSGGEAQRVKLAKYLGRKDLSRSIILLDEPSTGLHPQDLAGLLSVLERLVKAGATIVVVEHNTDFVRAADWIIDLGPGAGPLGGEVIYMGPLTGLLECNESLTGQALREEAAVRPMDIIDRDPGFPDVPDIPGVPGVPGVPGFLPSPFIQVRGARANNLKNVDVDFPKGRLTVVTGVSGSGKSSLVMDVLEAEAGRRYLETLSLYERQGLKEGPQAPVDSVSGLGVCITVSPDRKLYDLRSTVGTVTEIWHHLAVLLSTIGERTGSACGTEAPKVSPAKFSPFNYAAACTTCQGIGTLQVPRPEKLIRFPEKPLCGGAMFSPGFFPKGYLCKPGNGGYDIVRAFAARYGFDPGVTPWNQLTPEVQYMFLFGDPEPLEVLFRNPKGLSRTAMVKFNGFYGFIRDWDVGGTYTDTELCPACGGAKLRPEYLAITLNGCDMHRLSEMPLSGLREILGNDFNQQLLPTNNKFNKKFLGVQGAPRRGEPIEDCKKPPPGRRRQDLAGSIRSLEIIQKRLGFLERVGLGYLHLNRVTATLSAGEAQRVKLAGLLGSGLTSLTVLLDEPSRGLHPVEVGALSGVLRELRDEGNTVIVVEHDHGIIGVADHVIDVGPGAGADGGEIVACGAPVEMAKHGTVTGAWLRGERTAYIPSVRRVPQEWLMIEGARENNLKCVAVRIPKGVLVGVCGVSGSGKSTLLIDTVGRALAPVKHTTSVAREPLVPGLHDRIANAPARTVIVDQARKGIRCPANFLDISEPLANLFAGCAEAKALGLEEGVFKERCSVCQGSGLVKQDMGFLPDIYDECETCDGTGFTPEVREVRFRGYTLPEVNRFTLEEVYTLFGGEDVVARPLKAALDVGLGYLVLKQPGVSLSGGEAQRLKIAKELCRVTGGDTLYILDEPTVGQHSEDVDRLCRVLHRLVEEGNSIIVIEHHPAVLAACDWLIEMGPGGGPDGGQVIASGSPENIAELDTPTAPYLKEMLGCRRPGGTS